MRKVNPRLLPEQVQKKIKKDKRRKNVEIACWVTALTAVAGTILYACLSKKAPSGKLYTASDTVIDTAFITEGLNAVI